MRTIKTLMGIALIVAAFLVASAASQAPNHNPRYMPFGDSITDYGCWRAYVWQRLRSEGYTDIDFVGTRTSDKNCNGIDYDRNHEGHPGFTAVDIAQKGQLVTWFHYAPTDFITMHIGTNDIGHGYNLQDTKQAYDKLVDQMREHNPKMRIIVAQIIPLKGANRQVRDLNDWIPLWAAVKSTPKSPIWVVDQWSAISVDTDLYDGIHPNDRGDRKMAEVWYPAIVQAILSIRLGNRLGNDKADDGST